MLRGMPVAFDFDDDDNKEIVIGCSGTSTGGANAGIFIYKSNGTAFSSNPVYTPASGYRCDFPPVVTDINNDGYYDVVFISANGTTANIYAYNPHTAGLLTGWNSTSHPSFALATSVSTNSSSDAYGGQFCPSLSVGDVDKDGYPEVACGDNGDFYVWKHDGTQLSHFSYTYSLYSGSGSYYPPVTNCAPILIDIDNNNSDLEVVFLAAADRTIQPGTNIYAFKAATGTPVVGFPINIVETTCNSVCADNIDEHDNAGLKNELIVTSTANFYVWDSQGDATNNIYGWGSYRKDNYNSGVFYDMADGFLYDEDIYLQNVTTIGSVPANMNRYYFGRNVLVGSSVTGKKTGGAVTIQSGANVSLEGTSSVLLQADVTIPTGCTFEIK